MGGSSSSLDIQAKTLCKAAIQGADRIADKEDKIFASFTAWDKDASGKISKNELIDLFAVISPKVTTKQIGKLLKEVDKDKDGELSLNEITAYMFQAPHLEKYFKESRDLLEKHLKAATKLGEKVMSSGNPFEGIMKLGGEMQKLKEKQQAEINKKLAPLIKQSFAWHDKDSSGVLERDEGVIFFSNYAGMLPAFFKDVTKMTVLQATSSMEKQMKKLAGKEMAQAMVGTVEDQMKGQLDILDFTLGIKEKDYRANADERHIAAWNVLDVNKDGKLQEEEVVDALLHGHPKNEEFMKALGIFAEPAGGQPGMAGQNNECVQLEMGQLGGECEQQ